MATTTHHRLAKEMLRSLRAPAGAEDAELGMLRHPEQSESPYWQAAALQVVPNESFERTEGFDRHGIVLFTRHAAPLGWALFSIRDALAPYLTEENRSLIFGQLGLALRRAQAGADGAAPRALLAALLDAADEVLEAAAEAHRMARRRRAR
jgi:hypothetical protein